MPPELKLSIASFAIICFVLNVDATLKTTSIQQVFPNNTQVRVVTNSVANSSIAYLICNTNCSVVLQTLNLDGTKTEASCSFEPTSIENFYFDIELQIIPVNNDRVIIGYIRRFENLNDYDYVFASIRLSDCKITEATIPQHNNMNENGGIRYSLAKEFALTKNNDDTYTILFSEEKLCGFNYCRMSLNAEGEVVGGPTSWFQLHHDFHMPDKLFSASTNLSSEKYAIVYSAGEGWDMEFSSTESNQFKKPISVNGSYALYGGYSVAYGLFTACLQISDEGVECSQYDLAGNVKFSGYKTTLKDTQIVGLLPYSLPNGGFLLYTIGCPKPEEKSHRVCPDFDSRIYGVSKFDAQGKLVGSLEIEVFTCNTDIEWMLKPSYYVNEASEHCLFLVCTNIGLKKYLKSAINCFSDEDFKM